MVSSKRTNSVPTTYIAKVIDSYQMGSKLFNYGQGEADVFAACRSNSMEYAPNENPFIRALSAVTGMIDPSTFTMRDLAQIDPNVPNVTQAIMLGQMKHQLTHAGQMEGWGGSSRETVIATLLCNAIPALMMEHMISNITLTSTNHDSLGNFTTIITGGRSFTNMHLVENYELFKRRLEMEVINDFTYGNQETYAMRVNADLIGDTTITIALGSNPEVTYTVPSFCDALIAPVIATNKDHFYSVVNDFDGMIRNIIPDVARDNYNSIV
jgi:hypothetical protein